MIETLLTKATALLLAPALLFGISFTHEDTSAQRIADLEMTVNFLMDQLEEPSLGVALPSGTAVFETSLASGITSSADTFTLTANSVRGGGSLSGYQCFTIDEGTAQSEYVCGTVATTTVSGLERGLSPADGITEDTDLQFSHRRGASVKITDFPLIQRLKSQNNGEGTFANALSYAAGVTPTGNSHLTDVEYVASVVNGGTISFDQLIISGTAGETVASGTIVYKNLSDGEWYKADVDDTSTYIDMLLGMTQGAGTNGASISGGVLLKGLDANQTGLTANSRYFLSSTAGGVTLSTTSQAIGVSISTTELAFDPYLFAPTLSRDNTWTGDQTFDGSLYGGVEYMPASSTFTGATTPQPVNASTTLGTVTLADGNVLGALKFIGFAVTSTSTGGQVGVQTAGIVPGFSGLTIGATYYLNDAVGTISTTTGTYSVQVGVAVSATELLIQKGKRYASGATTFSAATDQDITVGFRPTRVTIFAMLSNGDSRSQGGWTVFGGNDALSHDGQVDGSPATAIQSAAWYTVNSAGNGQTGAISGVTDTGFTLDVSAVSTIQTAILFWTAEGEI